MDRGKADASGAFTKPVVRRMSRKEDIKTISDVFYLQFITYITEIIRELVLKAASIATRNNRNTIVVSDIGDATKELYGQGFYEGCSKIHDDEVFLKGLGLQRLMHTFLPNRNYRFQSASIELLAKVISNYSYHIFAKAEQSIKSQKRVVALDRDLAYAISQIDNK